MYIDTVPKRDAFYEVRTITSL